MGSELEVELTHDDGKQGATVEPRSFVTYKCIPDIASENEWYIPTTLTRTVQ